MTDLEQAIAELLYLKRDCLEGSATDQTLDKAIARLKAQEPRVLKLDEVRNSTRIPLWLEAKSKHKDLYRGWVLAYMVQKGMGITGERLGMTDPSGRMHWFKLDDYGRTWRVWDSDPTDAQRRSTRWA